MRVIGLTGSIACGKSAVSDWLRRQPGCLIIDGDQLAHELTAPGGAALPEIRRVFGDAVFLSDGSLNRRRLGRMVFSHPEARQQLDDLMAPYLRELTEQNLVLARREGFPLCFLDYPLLFEKGYDSLCDTIWCVYLPREIQLQRLMARDQLSEEEALARMDAVLSSEEKAARSQVVIDNSGELSFTLSTLPPLLEAERQLAGGPRRRRSAKAENPEAREESAPTASEGISRPDARGGNHAPAASPSPGVMERPAGARRKTEPRKAGWMLPSWMITLLVVAGFLLLGGITAQALMRAYLVRQAEQHLAEDRAIHANYPLEYREIIEAQAEAFNLNPAFVAAIVRNESSFQPRAESSVGARGLMQLMPETAEWIAGKLKISSYAFDRMYDPESNIQFGCWYLRYLANLFHGDPVCVACAYHAGQGQVTAWLSDTRLSQDGQTLNLSAMNDGPTKTYAGRVIRAYGIYQALYFEGTDAATLSDAAALDTGLRQ